MNLPEIKLVIETTRAHPDLNDDELINEILDVSYPQINDRLNLYPSLYRIFVYACWLHGKKPKDVMRKSRKGELVRVRQQYYFIAHLFGYKDRPIADVVLRDRASIINGRNRALGYYNSEKVYKYEIEKLIAAFNGHSGLLYDRLEQWAAKN